MRKFLRTTWFKALATLTAGYASLTGVVGCAQSSLLFFPSHEPNTHPQWQVDGQYAGICLRHPQPRRIVYLIHGNARQANDRAHFAQLLPPQTSLYVLEYPGFGPREGTLSQASIEAAALDAYDALAATYPSLPLIVMGESMGSGPASHVAALRHPSELCLLTPYRSLPALAQEKFPLLPAARLIRFRWDNAALLHDFPHPISVIAARDDEVIPVHHAESLANVLRAQLLLLDGRHSHYDREALRLFWAQRFE